MRPRLHLRLLHDEDLSAPACGVTNRRGIRPSHQMLVSRVRPPFATDTPLRNPFALLFARDHPRATTPPELRLRMIKAEGSRLDPTAPNWSDSHVCFRSQPPLSKSIRCSLTHAEDTNATINT